MDARPTARSVVTTERTDAMAELRRCIGSARFGIEAHDAPIEDFPKQPSRKDGLGRMCKTHWNQYTAGLARDAKARKAAADGEAATVDEAAAPVVVVIEAAGSEPPEPAGQRARRSPKLRIVAGPE
jgi:hypothetical protein